MPIPTIKSIPLHIITDKMWKYMIQMAAGNH